jgi:organic hydroperoxide reductase OsmC/OhrA
MEKSVTVTLTQQQDYQFLIDFSEGMPQLLADEPDPLGQGVGPSPDQLLMAASANCLAASLLFALRKFKQDPGRIVAKATGRVGRNEEGRVRVLGITVHLALGKEAAGLEHLDRILGQFEAFCTVSQSIQSGIPITVQVSDGNGAALK